MEMKQPFLIVDTETQTNPEIFIFGEIDNLTSYSFINRLEGIDYDTPITIRISSEGGNVLDGIKIAEFLKKFKNTECIIEGICFSIATYIALQCDRIYMTENSYFLIHNPWSLAMGDAEELLNHSETLKTIEDDLLNFYIKKSGQSEEIIKDLMRREAWLSASQCLELNFIDEIVSEKDNVYNFKNILKHYKDNIPKSFMKIYKEHKNMKTKTDELNTSNHEEVVNKEDVVDKVEDVVDKVEEKVEEKETVIKNEEATEEKVVTKEYVEQLIEELKENMFERLTSELQNIVNNKLQEDNKEEEKTEQNLSKEDVIKMLDMGFDSETILQANNENKTYNEVMELQLKNVLKNKSKTMDINVFKKNEAPNRIQYKTI